MSREDCKKRTPSFSRFYITPPVNSQTDPYDCVMDTKDEPDLHTGCVSITRTRTITGTTVTQVGQSNFYSKPTLTDLRLVPPSFLETGVSDISRHGKGTVKFPQMKEFAHFHYNRVNIGSIQTYIDTSKQVASGALYEVIVISNDHQWVVYRSTKDFRLLDQQIHHCVFDRKYSMLCDLTNMTAQQISNITGVISSYLKRFSELSGNSINCGTVLNFFEMSSSGDHLLSSMNYSAINIPAIAAAMVTRAYESQEVDELTLKIGDLISVIDMPPSSETSWWRGKKGFEVGFFPGDCVELIGGKPRPKSTLERPVSKKSQTAAGTKHNKLRAFLSHFFRHRPSRVQLKQSGIIGERVFGCDLGEYLLNTAMLVPHILKLCTKEIELHGVIDGIYRLSGSALKVQKLREEFDRCEKNEFTDEDILDIHAISSVLKTYFRELPIPLLTFQFYPQLVAAIQKPDTDEQVSTVKSIIEQLSPPHYRTSSHLFGHLNHLALMSKKTGMTSRNLAIVWAPNLMRHSDGKSSSAASDGLALLQNISLQAAVVDLLITNFDTIFNQKVQTDLKSFGKKTLGRPYAGRLITLVVARRQRTNEHLLYSTKKDKYGSLNKSKSSSAESFFESTSKAKKVHLLPEKKVQKAESCAVDDDAYMSAAETYVGTLTRDPSINRPMSDLSKDPSDSIGTIKGKLTESRSFNLSIGNSLAMGTQTGNRPQSMAVFTATRGTVAKGLEHPYGLVNAITTKFESEEFKCGMETVPTSVCHTSTAENISSDFSNVSHERNTKGPMPLPKPRQPRRPHDYVNVELNKSIPCETGQQQVTESRLKPIPSIRRDGKTTTSDDETKTLTPSCVVTMNSTTDDNYVLENPGFLRNTFPGHCTGTPQSQSVHQQLKLAFSNPKSDDDAIILPSHLHLSVDSL